MRYLCSALDRLTGPSLFGTGTTDANVACVCVCGVPCQLSCVVCCKPEATLTDTSSDHTKHDSVWCVDCAAHSDTVAEGVQRYRLQPVRSPELTAAVLSGPIYSAHRAHGRPGRVAYTTLESCERVDRGLC